MRNLQSDRRIVHLLDDMALGGVTRALGNFEHPELRRLGRHDVVDLQDSGMGAIGRHDVAIIHFTSNWRKLRLLLQLSLRHRAAERILIEHTYTAGFEACEVGNTDRFRAMLRLSYQLVDRVVAVSEAQRDWIISCGLAPAYKVTAVPQSRDCEELLGLPPVERGPRPLRLGAFGRFHRQKGFDLLIEAMNAISPADAHLSIAGTGPDAAMLRELAAKMPHVDIIPEFQSPRDFLQSLEAVAIPSRWEAFGLVGTEARAAGRPVILSDVDGLRDQAGQHAFTHRSEDVGDIARAIRDAVAAQNFTQRARLARREARYEYDRMIAGWVDLLENTGTARNAA